MTYLELPITPKITGCCASSPSKKNPTTTSPGAIRIGLLLPALPEPAVTGIITVAQGKSSSLSSTVFWG